MGTDDDNFYERTLFGGQSTFGKDKDVLHLKLEYMMNPYAVIEHVPEDWSDINVVIYHAYGLRFSMDNTLNIYVISNRQERRRVDQAVEYKLALAWSYRLA